VLAFARTDAVDPLVVTIVAKRAAEAGGWANTAVLLPEGEWRDVLTDDASVVAGGAEVPLGGWLDRVGVAVLERTETRAAAHWSR
jgi:maltooligosyltrehalose synthase